MTKSKNTPFTLFPAVLREGRRLCGGYLLPYVPDGKERRCWGGNGKGNRRMGIGGGGGGEQGLG